MPEKIQPLELLLQEEKKLKRICAGNEGNVEHFGKELKKVQALIKAQTPAPAKEEPKNEEKPKKEPKTEEEST